MQNVQNVACFTHDKYTGGQLCYRTMEQSLSVGICYTINIEHSGRNTEIFRCYSFARFLFLHKIGRYYCMDDWMKDNDFRLQQNNIWSNRLNFFSWRLNRNESNKQIYEVELICNAVCPIFCTRLSKMQKYTENQNDKKKKIIFEWEFVIKMKLSRLRANYDYRSTNNAILT